MEKPVNLDDGDDVFDWPWMLLDSGWVRRIDRVEAIETPGGISLSRSKWATRSCRNHPPSY
jgi:hypothetical protein